LLVIEVVGEAVARFSDTQCQWCSATAWAQDETGSGQPSQTRRPLVDGAVSRGGKHGRHPDQVGNGVRVPSGNHAGHRTGEGVSDKDDSPQASGVDIGRDRQRVVVEGQGSEIGGASAAAREINGQRRQSEVGEEWIPHPGPVVGAVDEHVGFRTVGHVGLRRQWRRGGTHVGWAVGGPGTTTVRVAVRGAGAACPGDEPTSHP